MKVQITPEFKFLLVKSLLNETLNLLPVGSHIAILTGGLFHQENHYEQEELMQLPSHSPSYFKSHGNQMKVPVTGKRETSHS